MAGATKEEAGEAGDPKNVIAPLADNVRDTSDPSGSTPLPEDKGTAGTYLTSGYFALRLDGFAFSTEMINGEAPEEGRNSPSLPAPRRASDKTLTMFDITGGDFPLHQLLDSDGERGKPARYRKAKRDEDPEHEFKLGDGYTFRIVFVLPKDSTAKKLTLGRGSARKWTFDVSDTK